MIENRNQLIGLLSTTSGYADKHPEAAAEILACLDAAGLAVVPKQPTIPMCSAPFAMGWHDMKGALRAAGLPNSVWDEAYRAMVAASPVA